MAATKDWNGYIQINTELKWRHTKNMNVIKESRFADMYIKAEELKRFWDMNKVVDRWGVAALISCLRDIMPAHA
jgi:hypothetical protein